MNGLRRGFAWSALANITITGSAALLTFILPFYLNPTDYGVWQYYALLVLWLGYGTLGVADGWFTRYAGMQYWELPGYSLRWHTLFVAGATSTLTLVFLALASLVPALKGSFRYDMLVLALIGSVFFLPRSVLFFALQGGRRYAATFGVVLVERLALVLGGVFIALGLSSRGEDLALFDIGGKALGLMTILVMSGALIRQKSPYGVLKKAHESPTPRSEIALTLRVGLPIALAAIASIAVYGVPRLIIEFTLGLDTFASVSLAVSLSLFLVGLFGSLGIVIFPELRAAKAYRVRRIAHDLEWTLVLLAGPALALAWPMSWAIRTYLPDYSLAADCLWPLYAALFAEARARFISSNILRLSEQQGYVLVANILAVALASLGTWVMSRFFADAVAAMYCILAAILTRGVMLDVRVGRVLQESLTRTKSLATTLPVVFVLLSFLPNAVGVPAYILVLSLVITATRTQLRTATPAR